MVLAVALLLGFALGSGGDEGSLVGLSLVFLVPVTVGSLIGFGLGSLVPRDDRRVVSEDRPPAAVESSPDATTPTMPSDPSPADGGAEDGGRWALGE